MGFYDELADTAKTLLTEFGVPCSIEQKITTLKQVRQLDASVAYWVFVYLTN